MSLIDKIKKNTKIMDKGAISTIDQSIYMNNVTVTPTDMPVLNLALSGELDGGLQSGVTIFAGPSKHFKSNLTLFCIKAYLDRHKDSVCVFFDNEFGITTEYLENMNIDTSRMVHIPFTTVEELRNELAAQIDGLTRGDKVVFMVDSIGNVASKKEMDDVEADKSATDMGTRAKALKSLFRVITAKSKIKDVPVVMINQVYKDSSSFIPKDVMGGGQGPMLAAQSVIMLTRAQEKTGTDIKGYTFTMKVEKGRKAREGSKLKFTALFDKGVLTHSGLFDIAMATGHLVKVSNGWYTKAGEDKKYREAEINSSPEFWESILADDKFKSACRKLFKIENSQTDELEDDIDLESYDASMED